MAGAYLFLVIKVFPIIPTYIEMRFPWLRRILQEWWLTPLVMVFIVTQIVYISIGSWFLDIVTGREIIFTVNKIVFRLLTMMFGIVVVSWYEYKYGQSDQ